jgi:hypothetical protein
MPLPPPTFPARIWIRVDSLAPLTCSVRFLMTTGEGYLSWGATEGGRRRGAMRSGTAGGLSTDDLAVLCVEARLPGRSESLRFPLHIQASPVRARRSVGEWVELADVGREDFGDTDLVFATDVLDTDSGVGAPELAKQEPPESPEPLAPVPDLLPASVELTGDVDVLEGVLVEDGYSDDLDDLDGSDAAEAVLEEDFTSVEATLEPSSAPPPVQGIAAPPAAAASPRAGGTASSTLVRSLVQRIRMQEEEIKSLKQKVASLEAELARGG